jgi:hypothetical protein
MTAIFELLLNRGASTAATTRDGRTPAELAANDELRALLL